MPTVWAASALAPWEGRLPPDEAGDPLEVLVSRRRWLPRPAESWPEDARRTKTARHGWRLRVRRASPQHLQHAGQIRRPTQVLVLLELLRRLGYPDLAALEEDMTDGFQMLGDIRPGPGWSARDDGRYQNPIDMEELRRINADYVRAKVASRRPDEHAEKLLQELIAEKRLRRVIGPTHPPPWLKGVTASSGTRRDRRRHIGGTPARRRTSSPPPFPVCQTDENGDTKVRRAEDWRRSGHNSTIRVGDVPTHHFIGSFVDLARRLAADSRRLKVFGHDLAECLPAVAGPPSGGVRHVLAHQARRHLLVSSGHELRRDGLSVEL